MEERHSGNGFSYAIQNGYLKKYAMLGLHKSYNNQFIIDQINSNEKLLAIWMEDIFIQKKVNFQDAIKRVISFVKEEKFGVELDMDALENTLSSALTPVGISPKEAMQYLFETGKNKNSIYLHLPEAVYKRADGMEQKTIGKLLSYLVQSFVMGKTQNI